MSARPFDLRSPALPVCIAAALGLAAPASSETFLDMMAGISWTQEGEFDLNSVAISRNDDEDPDDSFNFGVRIGHYFEDVDLAGIDAGIAVDVSYFEPHIENPGGANLFDMRVIPISFLATARLPLAVTKDLPNGRFQPYIAAGPSLFLSLAEGFFGFEDVGADIGADARAGVNMEFMEGFGLFIEYRFSYSKVEIEDRFRTGSLATTSNARAEAELLSHHGAVGLRIAF